MAAQAALFLAVVFMAYANGANDNFKGVATLFGCGAAGYRQALAWATLATFSGSLFSVVLAAELLRNFSGKGLVPDAVAASPVFLLAVALGTTATVILATWTGFPISTTHALTGALLGGGVASMGSQVDFSRLGQTFFLPLALSPLAALLLAAVLYLGFKSLRQASGIGIETCLCVEAAPQVRMAGTTALLSLLMPAPPSLILGSRSSCAQKYRGRIFGVRAQSLLDAAHFLSGGLVSFARGLNDTPKLVALLLGSSLLGLRVNLLAIALGMALGGLLHARKVAVTMSRNITPMNHGQGFTANLVTAGLVVLASRYGLPMSTTHVSVGSISGIGMVTGQGNPRVLAGIGLAWVMTLPMAALMAYLFFKAGNQF